MVFNSVQFILFFVAVTCAYYNLSWGARWKMLLFASAIFYMAFIPLYILILLVTIAIDYGLAIKIHESVGIRRKRLLVVGITATTLILFVFKYFYFSIELTNALISVFGAQIAGPFWRVALPIGLSFHTFQSLSYVVEVYYGRQVPERNFGIYSLYVMFYPQLVAGPIERPQNLLHQFYREHKFSARNFVVGMREIAWGFFKKCVIADRVSPYVDTVYADPAAQSGVALLIATFLFSVQIYTDFSGYSSIARGCARVLGFNLMRNFNRPYFATSISDFWRRWHISLSTWFRDYVYLPLGGNRLGLAVTCRNIMVTFFLSGIWHGAKLTFVIWGLYCGALLVGQVFWAKVQILPRVAPQFLSRIVVLVTVSVGWVFFRANSLGDAVEILTRLRGATWQIGVDELKRAVLLYRGDNTAIAALLAGLLFILLMFSVEFVAEFKSQISRRFLASVKLQTIATAGLFFAAIAFGNLAPSSFIYFQF